MRSIISLLVLLLLMLVLSSCTTSSSPTPAGSPAGAGEISPTVTIQASATPTYTPAPSNTPLPSATPTITSSPTSTSTQTPPSTPTQTPLSLSQQLSIFENIWQIINDTYVYQDFNGLDWNAVHQDYKEKITAGLTNDQFYHAMSELIFKLGDEHSTFLNPQQNAEEQAEFSGKTDYVGIGVLVSAVPERQHAVIISVFHDSPAQAVGLQPRDSIISVDGTPILDESGFLRDIVRGPEGTTITLLIQTPGAEPREVRVTRHHISGEVPVFNTVIPTREGKRIGYIFLATFQDSTVDEQVAAALQEMTADAPLDGLILDNRMNGGGSSAVLEPMLGFFAGGTLGNFIKRDEVRPLEIKLNDINGSSEVPLVVLVGRGTASFGEIYAGILQDIGRAYLIGQTTEGNVEILWGYDLEDGSRMWLANETFRPVNHTDQDWEKTGVIPDLSVGGEFDEFLLENDPAVVAAIQYLSSR